MAAVKASRCFSASLLGESVCSTIRSINCFLFMLSCSSVVFACTLVSYPRLETVQTCERSLPFSASLLLTPQQVASNAESSGAPQDLVNQVRNANTERFNSPEEVMQALQSGLDLG